MREKDLVLIPRKEYELLLNRPGNNKEEIIVRRSKSFKVPKRHEKFYDKLDKTLTQRLREYEAGKFHGPFETADEVFRFLESRKVRNKKQ